jgi:CheY-like chemotaxis protein/HPt (histidine-containing phosphotransfer) domain-containing protein
VDDDELSRELIALLLQSEGHEVIKAASGQEALQLLNSPGGVPEVPIPDVLITDMQMPEMSGPQLCRQVRETKNARQPLLIGMSASMPPEEQLQEFDAFVSKPIDPQSIQKLLADRLARSHARVPETELDPAASPLDDTVVDKLRKLMPPAALDELYATYLSDTRQRLAQMEAAAASGDQAEVRRSAHMMKGSAAMTGAAGIRRVAALLESTDIPAEQQRALFHQLRCACDAIEGTLARDARIKEAHDHQTT